MWPFKCYLSGTSQRRTILGRFFKAIWAKKTVHYLEQRKKKKQTASQNTDTNGKDEGVQGKDRTAPNQAVKNKRLEDIRLGIRDF